MADHSRRLEVLKKVQSGELSLEEGDAQLREMELGQEHQEDALQVAKGQPAGIPPQDLERFKYWKRWWVLPFGIGLALALLSSFWMYLGFLNHGASWGFWLSWLPFLLGVLIASFAWESRYMRWLHVRVQEKKNGKTTHINISMPLPLRFAAWVMRTFSRYMPEEVRARHIDTFIEEADSSLDREESMVVVVDEENEHVEVVIEPAMARK